MSESFIPHSKIPIQWLSLFLCISHCLPFVVIINWVPTKGEFVRTAVKNIHQMD